MTQSSVLRRRPDHGGYARGEETRARIIAAALQVFGTEGYARARTRQIAAVAGVMPPALQYYFDSKEGLHRACAQYIVDQAMAALAPALAGAGAAALARTPEGAVEALGIMLDALVELSLAPGDGGARRQFLARGQVDGGGPAFAMIRDGLTRPVHEACAALVAVLIGRPSDDEQTRLRTVLILSQLSGLHINRQNTLDFMNWKELADAEHLELVKAYMRKHTIAALQALTVSGPRCTTPGIEAPAAGAETITRS